MKCDISKKTDITNNSHNNLNDFSYMHMDMDIHALLGSPKVVIKNHNYIRSVSSP